MRILIIYTNGNSLENTRKTILDHLRTMEYSDIKHDLVYYNTYESLPEWSQSENVPGSIPEKLRNISFDAVILHYSFLNKRISGLPFYKGKRRFDWIRDLDALKIAIPQDEADYAQVLDEWLFDLGVSIIFSVHYAPDGPLYPIMRNQADIYPCLPGYIDERTAEEYKLKLQPIAEREKDIVYRARRLRHWYGTAGQVKYRIADIVAPRAKALGFVVDISTRIEDYILSNDWLDFLASSKAVIGTQGGWSVIDWRGENRVQIENILKENPSLSLEELRTRMPPEWDNYQLFTVTPRHFEAIITKTCQLLIEGEYKGILQPDKHYIQLKQDFSNLDDALGKLRDLEYLQRMVDCAYEDLYLNGQITYRSFAKKIEKVLIKNQKMEGKRVEPISDQESTNKMIEALERQLTAERHQNALLHAMYQDMVEQLPKRVIKILVAGVKARLKTVLPVVCILALVIVLVLVLFYV
jgi:hypothetical protein